MSASYRVRVAVAGLVVALAAVCGAFGHYYHGDGVHGFAVGWSEKCMTGFEYENYAHALVGYICQGD